MTPVSVDRTTLFYGTYVPERDPMDLMQCVVDIALVGLVSLTVIGVIAVTVLAAKAAKDGSHGCGLSEEEKAEQQRKAEEEKAEEQRKWEEELAEERRKALAEYHASLWERGICKHCRKETEVYAPDQQCVKCLYSDEFGPSY